MKKRIILASLLVLTTLLVGCSKAGEETSSNTNVTCKCTIRFLANIPSTSVTLGGGMSATGNNLIYVSKEIDSGTKVTKPEVDPIRPDYRFVGWYEDKDCLKAFDFNKTIFNNANVYAKWERTNEQSQETFVEPTLTFKETIDDSVEEIDITGVCNNLVNGNNVSLTTISLRKLNEKKDDCKELLNYKRHTNTTITSAKYANNKISVEYTINNTNKTKEINVVDITSTIPVTNAYYESKAKGYETNADVKPYSVVMGGSSSMENWSSSRKDMQPITTVNVGIGGTTVEDWEESLAQRLIFGFTPREVVLYVGINNIINSKKTGQETGEALERLFTKIHNNLPNTTIFYILMNLVPNYMQYQNYIEKGNEIALNYGKDKDYMQYIDAGTILLKENGKPNSAYFLTDGLHMSQYGYVLWGQKVKNSVIEFEKGHYGNKA